MKIKQRQTRETLEKNLSKLKNLRSKSGSKISDKDVRDVERAEKALRNDLTGRKAD